MKKAELVFIPSPGLGQLIPTSEIAKLMIRQDDRLLITILVMKPPFDSTIENSLKSLAASISSITNRIQFIDLPNDDQVITPENFLTSFVESRKPHVRNVVSELIAGNRSSDDTPRQVVGFVLGMFSTMMIDVAKEFGVPSYILFTSSVAFLGVMLHMQSLNDDHNVDTTKLKDSKDELIIPSFLNPVPAHVLPSVVFRKEWHNLYYGNAKRFKETKGIIVNSCTELEFHAVNSLNEDGKVPPLYPVGPAVHCSGSEQDDPGTVEITGWLDDQPPLSVVFLCFGSMGSLDDGQVKEIAIALERSAYRFLWSLRQPPPKGMMGFPTEYANLEDVLPEGFLERKAGIGKVIGWAPQVAILAHPAIGGFVSHCGWNSTLESIWFGVPMATWPLFSEQQLNAFQLIVELGLAVEIKMDYRRENAVLVRAEDIERGIKLVMEEDGEIRKRVKEMSAKCKRALSSGGSSHSALGRLIKAVADI